MTESLGDLKVALSLDEFDAAEVLRRREAYAAANSAAWESARYVDHVDACNEYLASRGLCLSCGADESDSDHAACTTAA